MAMADPPSATSDLRTRINLLWSMARHVRRSPEKLPANRAAMEKFELCMCVCVLSIPSRFTLADAKVKLLRARTAEAATPEGP